MKKKILIGSIIIILLIALVFLAKSNLFYIAAFGYDDFSITGIDYTPKPYVQQNTQVNVKLLVKNNGGNMGDDVMRVECGIYPDNLIRSWGYGWYNLFASKLDPQRITTNCNVGEEFVATKYVYIDKGATADVNLAFTAPSSDTSIGYGILCNAFENCYYLNHDTGLSSHAIIDVVLQGAGTGESCRDTIVNQDETDINCGGLICSPCPDGFACKVNADCEHKSCISGYCQPDSVDVCTEGDKKYKTCPDGSQVPFICENNAWVQLLQTEQLLQTTVEQCVGLPPLPGECSSDSDCLNGYWCVDNNCILKGRTSSLWQWLTAIGLALSLAGGLSWLIFGRK